MIQFQNRRSSPKTALIRPPPKLWPVLRIFLQRSPARGVYTNSRREDSPPGLTRGICLIGDQSMAHEWEMDLRQTKLDINVLAWRCNKCGCLQIKNGGLDVASVYKPNDPAWSPFKTLEDEPPCPEPDRPHRAGIGPGSGRPRRITAGVTSA